MKDHWIVEDLEFLQLILIGMYVRLFYPILSLPDAPQRTRFLYQYIGRYTDCVEGNFVEELFEKKKKKLCR